MPDPNPTAIFAGLTTLDQYYVLAHHLGPNEKLKAESWLMAAGGPAANAAATFALLGGRARLLTCLGAGPLGRAAREDLATTGVGIVDASPGQTASVPVSSVLVDASSGDRSVVSLNDRSLSPEPPGELPGNAQLVLIDGHYPELAALAIEAAERDGVPVLLDGGSWKPGIADLLPRVTIAVCSGNFHPEGDPTIDTVGWLSELGIPYAAVSRGAGPIEYRVGHRSASVPVPPTAVVDTSGAGDVLHGALAYALARRTEPLDEAGFRSALAYAATIAAASCRHLGARTWATAEPELRG